MPAEPADVVKVLVFNSIELIVPKLIIHPSANLASIEERRLNENLLLSPKQRIEKLFLLIEMAQAFSKKPLKQPQAKGLVLRVKR